MNTPKSIKVKMISMLSLVILLTIILAACATPAQKVNQLSAAPAVGTCTAATAVTCPAVEPLVNTASLQDVLLYHMVNKVQVSSATAGVNSVVTRQGAQIQITTSNGTMMLNDKVLITDGGIKACNGIIYVIDHMLILPVSMTAEPTQANVTATADATPVSCKDGGQTVAYILRNTERFSEFAKALESAGYMEMLDQDGYYTIFCPPNGVFVAPISNPKSGKITICHATSSAKNPYVEITIDVNGLNGHDKHKNDIIPAPAGGCPGKK